MTRINRFNTTCHKTPIIVKFKINTQQKQPAKPFTQRHISRNHLRERQLAKYVQRSETEMIFV